MLSLAVVDARGDYPTLVAVLQTLPPTAALALRRVVPWVPNRLPALEEPLSAATNRRVGRNWVAG